jgi:acyl-CoA thioesterase
VDGGQIVKSDFDTDTATQLSGQHSYTGHISPAWNIGTNPNGGYLVSVALNAMQQAVPHPDPISVTTHFLRPGASDQRCDIQLQVIRTGKSISTVRATLVQDDKPRVEVLAAFSDLGVSAGVDAPITIACPAMPKQEACVARTGDIQNLDLPITTRTEVRLHPELAVPGNAGRAEMAGWIRFVDERDPDTLALHLFADAFPPSPLAYLGAIGWVPTLELTVNVLRRPAPGWICAQFKTDELNHGRMIESGCLWDSTGALVAQSRQLGLVMAST